MVTWRSRLTKAGRTIEPLSFITLSNGTRLPAALYQALLDGYVGLLRTKGLLDDTGKFKPKGALDHSRVDKCAEDGRRGVAEAALKARQVEPPVGGRPEPAVESLLSSDRPAVPFAVLPDLRGTYSRRFGDTDFVALDVNASATVVRRSDMQSVGAQLDIELWLIGLGRVPLFRSGISLICDAYYDTLAYAHMQVAEGPRWGAENTVGGSISETFAPPSPWSANARAWKTTILVLGAVPVEVFFDLGGAADVNVFNQAETRWRDLRAQDGVLESALFSTPTRTPGLLGVGGSFGVSGGGEVDVSVDQAIDILSEYAPWTARALRVTAGLLDDITFGLSNLNLGKAGVSLDLQLGNLELSTVSWQRLDYRPTVHAPGVIRLGNFYELHGAANVDLAVSLLPGGSIEAYFDLAVPVDVDIDWWGPFPTDVSVEWNRVGDRFELWSWPSGFDFRVPLINSRWSQNIGPGSVRISPDIRDDVIRGG